MMSRMMTNALELSSGTKIFFVVLMILATLLLGYLLIRSVIKERKNWKERENKTGVVSYEQFEEFLTSQIQINRKTPFSLMRVDISESASLLKSLGELQYQNALSLLIENWRLLLDPTSRIAKQSAEVVYLYIKQAKGKVSMDNVCRLVLAESRKSILLAGTLKIDFDVNIGAVSYPESGRTLDVLKQNLQLAVVAAKRRGINQYAVYNMELSNKESEEYKNYLEIKNAIENKEFTLFYQPIVNLNSMEVAGAESLLRWKHKERGVLPPSSFLNIMEHTGDINWVGFWAMEQLFKQSLQWKSQYPDIKFSLNINLSAKQLMNPSLTDEIRRLIKKYRVNPADYCMEIIEQTLLDPFPVLKENINRLQQMGFQLALDNYGSAQSSLQVLSNVTLNVIKISRAFIKESIDNELTLNILNMLIAYARNNNIKIIAEGVENEEFLTYIRSIGIEYGQGYYFARPGSNTELMNAVILTPWNTK